jgi:hypothetical protein
LGFDAAVDRTSPDFRAELKAATPDRIDVYFDNTGGEVLGACLSRMATHGRIVCGGAVSAYDTATPGPSPRGLPGLLVNNRVRMEGFLVFDFEDRYDEVRAELSAWIVEGRLRPRLAEYEGWDRRPPPSSTCSVGPPSAPPSSASEPAVRHHTAAWLGDGTSPPVGVEWFYGVEHQEPTSGSTCA